MAIIRKTLKSTDTEFFLVFYQNVVVKLKAESYQYFHILGLFRHLIVTLIS